MIDEFIRDVQTNTTSITKCNLLRQARNMRREIWWFSIPEHEYVDAKSFMMIGEIEGKHVEGFDL